jgi:Ser/Thr protein kinase RdoA (MazF antagonist)
MGGGDSAAENEQLGERLGRGASSDVHVWGDGCVVKIYKPGFEDLAEVEALRALAVRRAGVPSPTVHGLVTVDDRVGLVFERVAGPWALDWPDAASITARVHTEIHDITAPDDLPRLVDTLADLGINGLPDGDRIFHGDLHPGNILSHGASWMVIDWSNAHRAPPAADVACSVLAIGYRGLRDGPAAAHAHRRRRRASDTYLARYTALRPGSLADLTLWTSAIGKLLLEREPETAFADELRQQWIVA